MTSLECGRGLAYPGVVGRKSPPGSEGRPFQHRGCFNGRLTNGHCIRSAAGSLSHGTVEISW